MTLNEIHSNIACDNLSVEKMVGSGDRISDGEEMEQKLIAW